MMLCHKFEKKLEKGSHFQEALMFGTRTRMRLSASTCRCRPRRAVKKPKQRWGAGACCWLIRKKPTGMGQTLGTPITEK